MGACSRGGAWPRGAVPVILAVALLLVVGAAGAKQPKQESFRYEDWGLEEAEAEVEALRREIQAQQEVVDGLKESLSAGPQGSCSAHDHECMRNQRMTAEPKRGHRGRAPEEKMRVLARLNIPKACKVTAVRWLPFVDAGSGRRMHRLLVAADSKGSLHFFNNQGALISSHPTGSAHPIVALAASRAWDGQCKIITGQSNGEVRVLVVSPPPRHEMPEKVADEHAERLARRLIDPETGKPRAKAAARILPSGKHPWQPMVEEISSFFPPKTSMLSWDNATRLLADLSGAPQPITFVEIAPRGKSAYNVIAGDAAGRVSMHIRNGSIVGSFELPSSPEAAGKAEPSPPLCGVAWGNFAAVCARKGLVFYNTKERFVYTTKCMGYPEVDEGVEEGDGKQKRKAQRPTKQVESKFVSLVQDVSSQAILYAGTDDGRVLVLAARGEGKTLRCTVQNDIAVTLGFSNVQVAAFRGFVAASATPADGSISSLNLYNTSSTGMRGRMPELQMYIPLEYKGKEHLMVASDSSAGLVAIAPSGSAFIYHVRASHAESSDTLIKILEYIRSPAVLVLVAGVVFWQVKKKADKQREQGRNGKGPAKPWERWDKGRGMTDAASEMAGFPDQRGGDRTDQGTYGTGPPRYGGTDADRMKRYGVKDYSSMDRRTAEMHDRVDSELHTGAARAHYGAQRQSDNNAPTGAYRRR